MDLSTAGNNGTTTGTLALSASVPSGAAGGTQSISTIAGGIITDTHLLLGNSAIATAGGFQYKVNFMWDGTDSTTFAHTQKIIDYAGTESLQLVTTSGSALLQMAFADNDGNETVAVSTTVVPNTWYDVTLTFDTSGNSVDGNGGISGIASLIVDGAAAITGAATKGTYGDGLSRPVGIGQLGANFGYLVGFKGNIYNPSVNLGVAVAPEPSSLAFGVLGGLGGVLMMWRARCRKT